MKNILELLAASYFHEEIGQEAVLWAIEEIDRGNSLESVRELASLTDFEPVSLVELLKRLLVDLGEKVPSEEQLGDILSKYYSQEIIKGSLDPFIGCRKLASLAAALSFPSNLMPFYSLSDLVLRSSDKSVVRKLQQEIIDNAAELKNKLQNKIFHL